MFFLNFLVLSYNDHSFFRLIDCIAFNVDMFLKIIDDGVIRPKMGYGECICCAYEHITSAQNPVSFSNERDSALLKFQFSDRECSRVEHLRLF